MRKVILSALLLMSMALPACAGKAAHTYTVGEPIGHGGLTIFPVFARSVPDTSAFITLDEGLRSGEVVVSEAGHVQPLVRGPHSRPLPRGDGAQVNRLVLVNNSRRPLLLLAGEIVKGGKQDRVVGRDRIVPPRSEPVDLGVFCVEPGRWSGAAQFDAAPAPMAQPSVRKKAMSEKNQEQVWAEVRRAQEQMRDAAVAAAAPPPPAAQSYAVTMDSVEAKRQLESVAAPVARSFESVMRSLRDQNAVGVVVAVNGRLIWADVFASTHLLEKYWPKLSRSYAAESIAYSRKAPVHPDEAQRFLADLEGTRQQSETEPGVFRHTEIDGNAFKVFQLESLLPKHGFTVHLSKMAGL